MKKKVLFEDFTNYYNKWTSGIASRELASQKVTLKDLFNKAVDQHPNSVRVEKPHPFPLPSVVEQLGELYLHAGNSKNLFQTALKNPLVNKNKEATFAVKTIISKLDNILKDLNSIIEMAKKPVAKEL